MKKHVQIIKKEITINRLIVVLFGSHNTTFPTIPKINENKGTKVRNLNAQLEIGFISLLFFFNKGGKIVA